MTRRDFWAAICGMVLAAAARGNLGPIDQFTTYCTPPNTCEASGFFTFSGYTVTVPQTPITVAFWTETAYTAVGYQYKTFYPADTEPGAFAGSIQLPYDRNVGASLYFNGTTVAEYIPPANSPLQPTGGYSYAAYAYLMTALQSISPQAVSEAIASFQVTNNLAAFVNSIGADVTVGVSAVISRGVGMINGALIGALDPSVAVGAKALHDAAVDSNPNTSGLLNQNQNKLLRDVMSELDNQSGKMPSAPTQTQNGKSTFKVSVSPVATVTLDPPISTSFIYRAGGSLKFSSVIFPHVSTDNSSYSIELLDQDKNWNIFAQVRPLQEFYFTTPVSEFRVTGIDIEGLPADTEWISGLGFPESGVFAGSIEADGVSIAAIPEPAEQVLLILGIPLLVLWRQRVSKRLSIC